jgi:hypothetical protein
MSCVGNTFFQMEKAIPKDGFFIGGLHGLEPWTKGL